MMALPLKQKTAHAMKKSVKSDHPSQARADTRVAPEEMRKGRRYSTGHQVVGGKRKVRYVETNDPAKGCKFL
jgi:hypothetical protein